MPINTLLLALAGAAITGMLNPAAAGAASLRHPDAGTTSVAQAAAPTPMVGHARFAGDDYPYATLGQFGQSGPTDGWNEYDGQCDSFAAWKVYENLGGAARVDPATVPVAGFRPADAARSPVWGTAVPDARTNWGDARDWGPAARAAGYQVDGVPHPGSIAWWDDSGPFTRFGHVGYVSDVYADGSITIESYNQRGNGEYSKLHFQTSGADDTTFNQPALHVPWPTGFVHIGDGPANVVQPPQPAPAVAFHFPRNVFGPGDGGAFSVTGTQVSGSNHGWYPWAGGQIGTELWTSTNGATPDSSATWDPVLQAQRCYAVDVFVPDNHSNAAAAMYSIVDQSAGTSVRTVDENAYTNQWASLGTFRAGPDGTLRITLTDQAPTGRYVAADGVRFRLLPSCPSSIADRPVVPLRS